MTKKYIIIDAQGGGSNSVYTQSFLISAWVLNGSVYQLTIPAATHGQGLRPLIEIDEETAPSTFEEVSIHTIQMDNLGNITLEVTANLDNRFDGRVRILGDG